MTLYTILKKNTTLRLLLFVVLFLIIYLTLVSLLVYVEKGSDQSALNSYSNAFWYSLVTISTVGYGDIFPATIYGRYISFVFIITSIGIFGILIGQLTALMTTIKNNKKLGYSGTNFTNHAVIIGWNDFGQHVADQLIGVGKRVAVITNKKDDIYSIHKRYDHKKMFVLFNDYSNHEMTKRSNIENSSIVFVNMLDDTNKLVYILRLKKFFPNIEVVVTLENGDLKNTFLAAGVNNTISTHEISSKLIASYMFEPDVASYSESVLSYAHSDDDHDIKQLLVTSKNPYNGETYDNVFFDLKKEYNSILIGIATKDEFGQKKLIKNPVENFKVQDGDYLIIILNGNAFNQLKQVFGVEEGIVKEKKK